MAYTVRDEFAYREYVIFTADQLVAHAVGDYVIQSHWMAEMKTRRWWPAVAHGACYALPFLFLTRAPVALAVIIVTHILIDRFRLARYVVWAKNYYLGPVDHELVAPTPTGYPARTPAWLATWLLIIADNVMHVIINGVAIQVLGGIP